MTSEKIQKVLARAGVASRRASEAWIKAGRIKVNGKIANIGQRVTVKDMIMVDDQPVVQDLADQLPRLLLYNKPLGEICTRSDPEGRKTVFAGLPKLDSGRWVIVGRLDINSEGLLLFTNEGELANKLMHPSAELEREYLARVFGYIDQQTINDLKKGAQLSDGKGNFKVIVPFKKEEKNRWYRVVVTEGRNRLVRRLWEAKKIQVSRLIRVRFCDILLPRSLISGQYKELAAKDVKLLLKRLGQS
ncbi:MAG: pseudouridine synthase [Gammaproteobacteria bacterium]|nr:pseudouridine synthase [Gammaproteobacteria bacterium]